MRVCGAEYSGPRRYHAHSKGTQEAHRAIRLARMNKREIGGMLQGHRLYDLIRRHTLASQMTDAQLEKATAAIDISGVKEQFVVDTEIITFKGFIKVCHKSNDEDENSQSGYTRLLSTLKEDDLLGCCEIISAERYSQNPVCYAEANLVEKLEELGIGQPSTYVPTISTI